MNLTLGEEELVSLLAAMGTLGERINVHYLVEPVIIMVEFSPGITF